MDSSSSTTPSRHRPPPIRVDSAEKQSSPTGSTQTTQDVTFRTESPARRGGRSNNNNGSSVASNLRTSRYENGTYPRTPYPPGTPKRNQSPYYGASQQQRGASPSPYAGVGTGDDRMDPQVYAALQSKQQELLATSIYIAQQQERIKLALSMQQQQQPAGGAPGSPGMQTYYYRDQEGNVWAYPTNPYTSTYGAPPSPYGGYPGVLPASAGIAPTASPSRAAYGQFVANTLAAGQAGHSLYSMGNGSTPSLHTVSSSSGSSTPSKNGKQRTNKGHKKAMSLTLGDLTMQMPPANPHSPSHSPAPGATTTTAAPAGPPGPQFDEYKVTVGSKFTGSTSGASGSNLSNSGSSTTSTMQAPVRQPLIPVTLEELKKTANTGVNFWQVGVARWDGAAEGRRARGAAVVGKSVEEGDAGASAVLKMTWTSQGLAQLAL
ncbi:uncharacterized protein V1518DRAFT_369655 [Limtongia smithiae]|uniref:uncharacterized protein n=1 Tax=Limtongia smithiae TaxID=1125753 RepID=UPI0034CD0FCC